MASVKLKNIYKYYGDNEVVSDLNLDVSDGTFLVLVGPSGCGKSTTLRMIAGLETVSSGEILIDGKTVNDVKPKDRDIAMVFQNYALYPHMSVYENMAFGLKLKKYSKERINERVNEAAQILELEELLDRKPKQLSGGQMQRVALGRAIVREPKVFLFDEPLSNLDAKLRSQMRSEIIKLHQTLESTMIYVTHDQEEAMTMGDQIVILNEGVTQQIDCPLDIYYYPQNLFVADFIGSPSMNFLEMSFQEGIYLVSSDNNIKLKADKKLLQKSSENNIKRVILGIRPEDIHLEKKENFSDAILASVELIETLGDDTLIHTKINDKKVICKEKGYLNIDKDSTVPLYFNMRNIRYFNETTGEVIPIDYSL